MVGRDVSCVMRVVENAVSFHEIFYGRSVPNKTYMRNTNDKECPPLRMLVVVSLSFRYSRAMLARFHPTGSQQATRDVGLRAVALFLGPWCFVALGLRNDLVFCSGVFGGVPR